MNADGSLKVETISSIDDLTDEDFTEPKRNVQLPELPENVATAIGTGGKPVVVKKRIFEKNRDEHKELTPEKSRDILQRALYSPNLVGTTRRGKRPDYRVAIQTGDKNAVVVLDVYDGKDNTEIVGWREIDAKGLAKMKKQAEREDGQLLILSPSNGSAAALSTLPSDSAPESKGGKESSTTQGKQPATAEKGTYGRNNEGIRFAIGKKRVTDLTKKELDKAYFEALDGNDMDYARQLVDEAARRAGYTDTESDYQGAGTWKAPRRPRYDTEKERRDNIWNDVAVNITDIADGYNLVDRTTFNDARAWGGDGPAYEALRAVQSAIKRYKENPKHGKIRVYRAIPKRDWTGREEVTLKEDGLRNGDWVSPSRDYAYQHGLSRFGAGNFRVISEAVAPKDLWWDGNDIREWGFDDGNEYRYQNTRNNRKLNDIVTYDYDGNIIPLSKRFNKRDYDARFSIGEPYDVKENPVGRAEPGLNGKAVTVVSVPRHNFKGTGKDALQAAGSWATDNLVGEYSNEETGGKGVMYISGNATSKFLSKAAVHKSDSLGAHLAVLKKFKDVLRESTDCESHPDFKKGKDGERRPENGIASKNIIHRLYGAVVIDGKTYRVKTTVKEQAATRKRNAPYTYEVTEIELLDGSMAGIINDDSQLLSDAPSNSISLAKLLKGVRMSYAEEGKDASEAKFLLDESRKRDEKEAGQTTIIETTKTVAAGLQDKFGTEAEVIESPDDVPNEQARKHIAAGENVKGWYDPKTGKVYLYAPNIESTQDAMATYAHEVIAHKGMEGLLGKERYAELYKRLGEVLTPEQRKLVKEYEGSDSRTLGDEYIARIAETLIDEQGNIKEPTTWEKVKAVVREFFRDTFGLELTDADIRYMLWRSGERLRRGKTDAARRAQDKATGDLLEARATIFRIVYHGTSADFDRFDHSHMGEGEGAQNYGWGTYVTDVKEIAAGYAERVGMAPSAEDYALKPDGEYQYREGYIYEVEIPDTDKGTYLVWNTPVKEELRNRIRSAIGDRPRGNILRGSMLGEDVYRELVDLLGDPKEASLFLSKLGVIGIRYPSDFMSGNRSLENSNFVIFNEDDLEIKKVSNPTRITKRTIDNTTVEITIETPSGAKEVVSFNGEGIRHGMARSWYPNSQLKSEDSYKYGRKDGLCRYWYVNGQIKTEEFYKMGERHGQHTIYKMNGDLSARMSFENGLRHGWGRSLGYFSPSETLDYYEHGEKLVEIYYPNRRTRDHVVVTQYDNNGHATQITGAEALGYIEKLPTDDTSLRFSTRRSKSTTRNRASQSMKGQHATVVSSGANAKIRSNLQELAKISKNFSGRTRGFIGKVAAALDMEQHEASNYKTFELDNGQLITLRVSNHNASTSLFDRNGENEGVSIVITNNANKGIKNNGVAHVIEFFYRKSDLEHSQNAPLAAIVTSIDKFLTTGEYVDTTGLAKVSEANATQSHVGSSAGAKHVTVARSAVAAMQDKFGIEAEVIESPEDVPNEQARKHIAASENVKGWYDPKR